MKEEGKGLVKTLDAQREVCLIALLKDDREHFLWGFPYYFFARQVLAVLIGLIQFIFGIILLIVRSILDGLSYLADLVSKLQYRKNPTEGSYIADKNNFIQDDECKGPSVNRATNTIIPVTNNKQCQVTDPTAYKQSKGLGFGGTLNGKKGLTLFDKDDDKAPTANATMADLPAGPAGGSPNRQRPVPGGLLGKPMLPQYQADTPDSFSRTSSFEDLGKTGGQVDADQKADALGLQREIVYFSDGEQTNFVMTEAFQSVLEFRSGIKKFYKFLGPLSQVRLELQGKELHDRDKWPIYTSKEYPVFIVLHSMYEERSRKKGVSARAELRGMTDLEARLAGGHL